MPCCNSWQQHHVTTTRDNHKATPISRLTSPDMASCASRAECTTGPSAQQNEQHAPMLCFCGTMSRHQCFNVVLFGRSQIPFPELSSSEYAEKSRRGKISRRTGRKRFKPPRKQSKSSSPTQNKKLLKWSQKTRRRAGKQTMKPGNRNTRESNNTGRLSLKVSNEITHQIDTFDDLCTRRRELVMTT